MEGEGSREKSRFAFLRRLSFLRRLTRRAGRPHHARSARPTSLTPIEAHVFVVCRTESFTVNRVGNVIKIHIVPGPSDFCDPPVFNNLTRVPIGTFPVGEYRIEVTVGELDSIAASRTFIVRDAVKRDVEIHPFAVPTQPFGLRLRLDAGDLGVARVFVDDVAGRRTSRSTEAYWFPAPAHARGFADVKIETTLGTTHTLPIDLLLRPRRAARHLRLRAHSLPRSLPQCGAHGSEWVSEAAIANTKPWFIETFNDVVPFVCIDYPCGERLCARLFDRVQRRRAIRRASR